MQAAQDSFISSTYWTERTGFVAALEVIEQFEKNKVADHLKEIGKYLKKELRQVFKTLNLKMDVVGLDASPLIQTREKDPLVIKTYFTQEMLKRGYLASSLIYLSLAHTKKIIDRYLDEAAEVLENMAGYLQSNNLKDQLEGPVCHSDFRRLT